MKERYQQGDVIITKIDDQQSFNRNFENHSYDRQLNQTDKSVVLALGEVTGHSHQFKPSVENQIISWHRKLNRYTETEGGSPSSRYIGDIEAEAIEILDKDMTLYHEEHAPIKIPKGTYTIKIVREFDHMSQTSRRVWD